MFDCQGGEPVKIKSSEKDQLIADLRQQLYDLKSQDRDYRGVSDEIINSENRYKILSDDKVPSLNLTKSIGTFGPRAKSQIKQRHG